MAKNIEINVRVPEGVHFRVSRHQGAPLDFNRMLRSHILLPIRARFGRSFTFEWINHSDWIRFSKGEKVTVDISSVYPCVGNERFQAVIQSVGDGGVIVNALTQEAI